MYVQAIVWTVLAWFAGLVLDVNIGSRWQMEGFLHLRVLFPILAMGLCILRAIKNDKKDS